MAIITFDSVVGVCGRYDNSFPLHGTAAPTIQHGLFSAACETNFDDDAHFQCCVAPGVLHRLSSGAEKLSPPVEMRLVAFDVDTPGHVPITDEWWAAEEPKLLKLIRDRGRCFVFSTRNGARIVFGVKDITLSSDPATGCTPERWSASYAAWLTELRTEFDIAADSQCASAWNLFRLPCVTRGGVAEVPRFKLGDPERLAAWPSNLLPADHPDCLPSAPRDVPIALAAPVPEEQLIAAAEALAAAWPKRGRHGASLRLCGTLARIGWTEEAIADFVTAVCGAAAGDHGNPDKRERQARDACNRAGRGETLAIWESVAEYLATGSDGVHDPLRDPVAEAAVLTARRALGDPPPEETWAAAIALLRAQRPPTDDEVRADLDAARTGLARSTKPDERLDYNLLGELKKNSGKVMLSPDRDREKIRAMLGAVARHARAGTTPQQAASQLGAIVPTTAAIEPLAAEAIAAARALAAEATAQGFAIDSDTGKPKPTQGNIRHALELLGVTLRYNLLCSRAEITTDDKTEVIGDDDITDLWLAVDERYGFRPAADFFYKVVGNTARQNPYHPVHDYLDALAWDGEERNDTWLIRLAGAPDTRFVRAVSRLVLIAACRRVRQPGAKFDEMLVLESPTQGTSKSTAIRTLCPNAEWFGDYLPLGGEPKHVIEATRGKWIVEAPELAGLHRRGRHELKALLARQTDEARMSYGRLNDTVPRQWIPIGSTNDEEYLNDPTGNRRIWPVRIERFDVAALAAERDQLWAEASAAERAGESIRLDEKLWGDAAEEQEGRQAGPDTFDIKLGEALGDMTGWISYPDMWRICGFVQSVREPQPEEQHRIGAAMKRLGWERKQKRVAGRKVWHYRRGDGADLAWRIDVAPGGKIGRVQMAPPEDSTEAAGSAPRGASK